MGSKRLPNKIMMEFCNKANLIHVFNRVSCSKKIDKVIIATTVQAVDDQVGEFCEKNNINCFRGAVEDVLDRYYRCGVYYGVSDDDTIVRITADCPLIDPEIIDKVIDYYHENSFDYASNTLEPTFPDGLDLEVFTWKALVKAWKDANLLSEREHVTPYIKKNKMLFKLGCYTNITNLSSMRWTLDEIEDYQFIKAIYDNLYEEERIFNMNEILDFLDKNPELSNINSKYIRDEGYIKSLNEDKYVVRRYE